MACLARFSSRDARRMVRWFLLLLVMMRVANGSCNKFLLLLLLHKVTISFHAVADARNGEYQVNTVVVCVSPTAHTR